MKNNEIKVLVVDDDQDCLFQHRLQLEQKGFKVDTADSSKDAEAKFQTFKPDVAVLDLMMESEDSGFVLSYKMKAQRPDVPVIIISGVTNHTGMKFGIVDKNEQEWIKADSIFAKPITGDQLSNEIKRLLKQ